MAGWQVAQIVSTFGLLFKRQNQVHLEIGVLHLRHDLKGLSGAGSVAGARSDADGGRSNDPPGKSAGCEGPGAGVPALSNECQSRGQFSYTDTGTRGQRTFEL